MFFEKYLNSPRILHLLFIFTLLLVHFSLHFLDFLAFKNPQYFFENSLILTSYDSYFYAKSTREFLEILNNFNILDFFNALQNLPLLSVFAGFFARITSLDFALCFSSVIFSSFTCVILYFLLLELLESFKILACFRVMVAFLGVLFAILIPAFYQRVGVGYFDTDMLLLALPFAAILCLLRFVKKQKFIYLILFAFFGFLSISWHQGLQNLLFLGFIIFICFEILLHKKLRNEVLQISSVFLLILTPSPLCFYVLISLLIFLFFVKDSKWLLFVALAFALFYATIFGLFNPLFNQINAYIFGERQFANILTYTSVVTKIIETSPINFTTLIVRSGGIFIFIFATFGAFLCARILFYSVFKKDSKDSSLILCIIFLFPFLLLGILSLKLGVRFSFFLTPCVAVFLSVFLAKLLELKRQNLTLIGIGVFCAVCFANLSYQIPRPILKADTIRDFIALDSTLKKDDFIFAWWDYGYALSYFTKAQVVLNGGRHSGAINFPFALMQCSDSKELFYNLSFLMAQNFQKLEKSEWNLVFEKILQDSKLNLDEFLAQIKQGYKPLNLAKQAQIYWVFPNDSLPLSKNICSFDVSKKYEFFNVQNYTKSLYISDNLTQVNFNNKTMLLSEDYLKSNLIKALIFDNLETQNIQKLESKTLKIFKLKE